MSIELEFFLRKSEEALDKAIKLENSNPKLSKEYYIKSAEYLLEAAKHSKGKMKDIRYARAEKIIKKANSMSTEIKEEKEERVHVGDLEPENRWIPKEKPNVSFNDIAGLDEVKKQIKLRFIYPYSEPEAAREYGIRTGGGLLLYGPPGTGKTYIAKAVAHEVNAIFFYIKPSLIMSQWVGVAEKNVEKLFEEARTSNKSVIFIDEIEALLPKRRSTYSSVMKRVVPQFLAELEGIGSKNENILFMGATNDPWEIDEAALRPGRFDKKIYVPPPDLESRKKIFEMNMKKRLYDESIDFYMLAKETEGYTGADIVEICEEAAQRAYMDYIENKNKRPINMFDIEESIKNIRPSVSKDMLIKYERFSEKI